jgi:hypothetical protein
LARTLAAALLPTLAISTSWLRLEDPERAKHALPVAGFALAPALLPRAWQRALCLAAAAGVAALVSVGAKPWTLLSLHPGGGLTAPKDVVATGLGDFYGVVLPFDPNRHPEMHALVLVAIFVFVAATALLIAARRPVAAGGVIVAGAGWPATLLGEEGAVAIGALTLGAALSVPLLLRVRSVRALGIGAVVVGLVVAGAASASSASTFARKAALNWRSWDFHGVPARALGVRFVWDANYDGISFPRTKTVVLEISGPQRAQYWRATTLDVFTDDRWIEAPSSILREGSGAVPHDPLTPARARNRSNWEQQDVQVKALVDDELVAAGTPEAVDARSLGTLLFFQDGVVRARQAVPGGVRYRIWSYVPDPSPAALAAAPARYPPPAGRFLDVWGRRLPPFGEPARGEHVRALFADARYPAFQEYRPLYDIARHVVGDTQSPYAAVLALESWFRQRGGFRYEEQPPRAVDLPPLVQFVTVTRAGYCQHFAGAMAVMLRLLGIPARVAVGFTSGKYAHGAWTVTDHDAHAWVEAWFPGQGWVPFDPTPGRGAFAGTYSYASESASAVAALRHGDLNTLGSSARGLSTDTGGQASRPSRTIGRPALGALTLALLGGGAFLVGLTKLLVRRARLLTRDPRRVATASRKELESFLRDQGLTVSPNATLDDLCRVVRGKAGLTGIFFAEAAGRGRFGRPSDCPSAARAARLELRILLRDLRRELSVWQRFRGFVSLRSLHGR